MTLKSKKISLLLSVAVSIFLITVGCGGGGGDSAPPPPPSSADLSLTKTVDVATPAVGSEVNFTITVSNAGPANATGVVVTDKLPSGFTYVSDSSGGTYNPVTGIWSVGTVAVGVNQVLTITATVNDSGSYINIAEVTASNQSDPNRNNNSGGVTAAPEGITVSINQIYTECKIAGATSDKAYVTVVDQLGNAITSGLTFTLTEIQNSQNFPVNFIFDFTDEPISISIVLDYSQSIFDSGVKAAMEDAAVTFINELSANDEAQIIKFNEIISVEQDFTTATDTGKNTLIAAVDADFPPAAVTELYLAIIEGIDNVAEVPPRPATNRKAVVVVTDGRNNSFSPNITVDTVIANAKSKDIPIFIIGLGAGIDVDDLTKLAKQTGGLFLFDPNADLTEVSQLAQALINNQYVFTYSSALAGGAPAPATLTVEADDGTLTNSDTKAFTSCP